HQGRCGIVPTSGRLRLAGQRDLADRRRSSRRAVSPQAEYNACDKVEGMMMASVAMAWLVSSCKPAHCTVPDPHGPVVVCRRRYCLQLV
ncbi:MAG: hypothetical protein PVH38_06790, partial [Gammaproteobacteria bacterium]